MPLTNGKKRIAQKDIKVYKIYLKTNKPDTYKSVYSKGTEDVYKLSETYDTGKSEAADPSIIGDGYFHSWATLETASKVLTSNADLKIPEKKRIKWNEGVVLECIIPKGSLYYIGEAGNLVSYASVRIRPIKEVFHLSSQPHLKFKIPSDSEIKEYYDKVVSKDYKDPQVYDEKRKERARLMWQIDDYFGNL